MDEVLDPADNYIQRNKKAIQRNKKTIAVVAVLVLVILLQNRGVKALNKFLTEKGLFEEYYYAEE